MVPHLFLKVETLGSQKRTHGLRTTQTPGWEYSSKARVKVDTTTATAALFSLSLKLTLNEPSPLLILTEPSLKLS